MVASDWGTTMPINRLLRDGKINPADAERLDRALALTLRALGLVDRNDPICEIVAHKIVEIDCQGTHDPEQIAALAAKKLGPS